MNITMERGEESGASAESESEMQFRTGGMGNDKPPFYYIILNLIHCILSSLDLDLAPHVKVVQRLSDYVYIST